MEFVDGELTMFDRDGEITHVFERGTLPKTFYNFVSKKVFEKYFFEISPTENWKRAEAEWHELTPEVQGHLMILNRKEDDCVEDIRLGLLATLAEYQGMNYIKELFEEAIKGVQVPV
jgi:hypothetical protein